MFILHTEISADIIQEFFLLMEQGYYNLKDQTDFVIPHVQSVNYGWESIQVLGQKIRKRLSNDLENKEPADGFKTAIKRRKPESCLCCLCKSYLENIGYL